MESLGVISLATRIRPHTSKHSQSERIHHNMCNQKVFYVFKKCAEAIDKGQFIKQVSETDKEFHFQNWFESCLEDSGLKFKINTRNNFPDFILKEALVGFEVKGLATPGRNSSFDSNSKPASGLSDGLTIYYVFGRYPKKKKKKGSETGSEVRASLSGYGFGYRSRRFF